MVLLLVHEWLLRHHIELLWVRVEAKLMTLWCHIGRALTISRLENVRRLLILKVAKLLRLDFLPQVTN